MPLKEAENLDVKVLSDIVAFDGEILRNMTELTSEQFYIRLDKSTSLPTTSHPSVGEYKQFFAEIFEGCDEFLFLSITSKMSGCYSTALVAAEEYTSEHQDKSVYVYDTQQCSHGMAQIVREAARLRDKGYSISEIVEALDEYRNKVGVYFILDTLKYARMGGRVGAIKALAADSMGIKPLLVFEKGVVRDLGVAKNFTDGLSKVLRKYETEADFTKPVTVFHQAAPMRAAQLLEMINEVNPGVEIRVNLVGPVIGVYTGSGGAGLAFEKK